MRFVFLIAATSFLCACSTVGTVSTVAKTTGKVAYKATEVTGKAVVGVGKGSAKAITAVSDNNAVQNVTQSPTAQSVDSVGDKATMGEAVLTPLSDINLRKQRIPDLLTQLDNPYAPVADKSCNGLFAELNDLDIILGPDMDAPPLPGQKSPTREASIDIVGAAAGSLIPFRGIVRAATGATQHERIIRKEYRKGVARRAYLRGIYDTEGCGY